MHTLQLRNERGHILIPLGDKIALIDTGSPASMASGPLEFLGEKLVLPANIMGVSLEDVSRLANIHFDALIGCDILARQDLRIRWRDKSLDIGDDLSEGQLSGTLTDLMGIPVFQILLQGNKTKALFDTGAHLSYINPILVAEQTPSGERDDFYPGVGQFTVPVYTVPTIINDTPLNLEYGVLPDSLQMMLGLAMSMSGASAVIGTQILESFDCTISWAKKSISWNKV